MNFLLDTNICLDLLDRTRDNASDTAQWYLDTEENLHNRFFLFSDAITTMFYILTERKKIDKQMVVHAMQKMMEEIEPLFFDAHDTRYAFFLFNEKVFDDLEDLLMLQTAYRHSVDILVTQDRKLLRLKNFESIKILSPKDLTEGRAS
ncbi:PIN domain-containing protein [Nitratifractor sp.]|uniref:type II toxin-antitoxin system VapC family toxin n=1 Tax=Nitratifractor sp. TaxID=2268144 RepID=UPI0025DCA773|nr:PIN domain-containing protein [Nitratifractor sp.]